MFVPTFTFYIWSIPSTLMWKYCYENTNVVIQGLNKYCGIIEDVVRFHLAH